MRITDLNTFSGILGASDYFATDNGNDTSRVPATEIFKGAKTVFFATSQTASGTETKIVDCSDFVELFTGAIVAVKFTNEQTSNSSVYLNVNDTGAKQVYGIPRSTASVTRMDGAWDANEVKFFVYDGTYWRIINQNIITSSELTSLESTLGI